MKKTVWMGALAIAALTACGGSGADGGGGGGGGGGGSGDSSGGERGDGPHGLHAGSHGSCMREAQGVCHEVLRAMTDESRAAARTDCEAQGGRWSDGICPSGDSAIAWCGDSTNTWFYGPTANLESAHAACPAHMHFYDLSEPESRTAIAPPLHERADGSCTTTTPPRCQEYVVDPAQLTSTGEACTSGGGAWASTPCATAGAVGHCGLAWFYGTAEEAQGMCANGTEPFIPTAR